MEVILDINKCSVENLKNLGYAIVLISPDELQGAESEKVEDRLIELSWDIIDGLSNNNDKNHQDDTTILNQISNLEVPPLSPDFLNSLEGDILDVSFPVFGSVNIDAFVSGTYNFKGTKSELIECLTRFWNNSPLPSDLENITNTESDDEINELFGAIDKSASNTSNWEWNRLRFTETDFESDIDINTQQGE